MRKPFLCGNWKMNTDRATAVSLAKATARTAAEVPTVEVGACPDMLTFTPDGTKVLTANEGQPSDDYTIDPEGSVSIIDVSNGALDATVTTADFSAFNDQVDELRAAGVRIFAPGASVAEDVEPEYIAVSSDSTTAWVALQENNALAILDVASGEFTSIEALGFKGHLLPGNGLDASDKDEVVNIANWPVKGMYQPDGIAVYETGGETYVVTANEGDARDYDGFSEEARVKDLLLGGPIFAQFGRKDLQADGNLGRLKVTTAVPSDQRGNNGCYHELYSYGTRSFSIFTAGGELVFDSGSDFEEIMADPDRGGTADFFNSSNDESELDARSDDKGPEPEAVVLGEIGGQTIAFVGLERQGGIMIYDITDPSAPVFQSYVNNRNFDADPTIENNNDDVANPANPAAGDLGPEGLKFIPAGKSPTGTPLLVTANEISGTTTIFEITMDNKSASANDAAIAAIGTMDVLDAKANAKRSSKGGNSAADKTANLIASLT